ncbi:MAG: hypothetical protein RIC14_07855 [Filomicrobium sp.]
MSPTPHYSPLAPHVFANAVVSLVCHDPSEQADHHRRLHTIYMECQGQPASVLDYRMHHYVHELLTDYFVGLEETWEDIHGTPWPSFAPAAE